MAGFDLNKLMQDPSFTAGIGLLGGASPSTRPLLTAYQLLKQQEEMKLDQERQQQMLGMQQQRLGFDRERLDLDREEHGTMKEYRKAQAETARATAAKYAEQVEESKKDRARKEANQKWIQQMMPSLMRGALPPGMMPQGGAEPPPQPMGRHGTPKQVLMNLKQVESNGNPLALGPDIGGGVRAQGAFQFLPSTVKMLTEKYGYPKFDPFNEKQAEDAADFYLSKLVEENGGDMTRALAQYGGFKTKDHTSYTNRVLKGSPEAVAKMKTQNQAIQGVQQQNEQTFGPSYAPGIKIDAEGELELEFKPSYEPQRIRQADEQLELGRAAERRQSFQTSRDYGPGGFKERESARQDADQQRKAVETGVQVSAEERQQAKQMQERKEAKTKDWRAISTGSANLDMLSKKIWELDNHPGVHRIFGARGAIPDIPGTPAADARAKHTSIVKQLAKEALQAIREGSPTGGALGNVSDKDIELLETALQNLGSAQSVDSARSAMKEVQRYTAKVRNVVIESFEKTHGESPLQGLPVGTRVAGVDPKTGKTFFRLPNGKFAIEK